MASTVDAKLLKKTKFPAEFDKKVDFQKVNVEVIKKWIAGKISEILGDEDDVVTELCFNLLEGSRFPDIKKLQIQLNGFLEKDTAKFCKELWSLCLSAQSNPQGVPKELLEAKKLELIQEKIKAEKASQHSSSIRAQDEARERDIQNIRNREQEQRRGRGDGRWREWRRDSDRRRPQSYSRSPPRRHSPEPFERRLRPAVDTYVPDSRSRASRRESSPYRRPPRSRSRSVSPAEGRRGRGEGRPRRRNSSLRPLSRTRERGRGERKRRDDREHHRRKHSTSSVSSRSRSRSPRRRRSPFSPSASSPESSEPDTKRRSRRDYGRLTRSRSPDSRIRDREQRRRRRNSSSKSDRDLRRSRADSRKDRDRPSRTRRRNTSSSITSDSDTGMKTNRKSRGRNSASERSQSPGLERKRRRSIEIYEPRQRKRRNSSSSRTSAAP